MKTFKTTATLLLLLASPVSYSLVTGNELVEYCKSNDRGIYWGMCRGYIYGVYDRQYWVEDSKFESCPPDGVTIEQMTSVVRKYLTDRPEKLHSAASALVTVGISLAWPCSD